jgi:hypothetical protein
MTQHPCRALITLTFVALFAMPALAQVAPINAPTAPPPPAAGTAGQGIAPPPAPFQFPGQPQVPPGYSAPAGAAIVNVQVVISRFEGEKRISSHPYNLTLVPGKQGSLRIGAEVAIPTTVTGAPGIAPSYTMQSLGTQIDCTAKPLNDNRYELGLTVTDRSVYPTSQTNQLGVGIANVPTFRNVTSSSTLILGNGQSAQFTASTDKVTGEVYKIDVTLTVPK